MTVLVADDNDAVLELIARVLSGKGFAVVKASTGRSLVAAWRRLRCRVVLSDADMPGALDGIEACRTIRGLDPGVRAYVMSGYPDCRGRAEDSGLSFAFAKPFTLLQLRRWADRL